MALMRLSKLELLRNFKPNSPDPLVVASSLALGKDKKPSGMGIGEGSRLVVWGDGREGRVKSVQEEVIGRDFNKTGAVLERRGNVNGENARAAVIVVVVVVG